MGWMTFPTHKSGQVHILIVGFPDGQLTATGALEASGTNFMVVRPSGKSTAIHCINSVVTPQGSFTILMDCQFITTTGQWRITNGTGAYKNLRGNGSLTMYFNEQGQDVEELDGIIH
jgi:hypothetical protein